MKLKLLVVWAIFIQSVVVHCKEMDAYHESVTMDVINNNKLYSFFNFTTIWDFSDKFAPHHYNLFPRTLGELILKYQVAELHFTMTQGLWRNHQWGLPHASAPTGAQLWVWFDGNTVDVDKNWIGFTNALSGLFCASLNFINKAVTVTPTMSFFPTGAFEGGYPNNKFLRYGTLSRENLCTENLTPWMKLLPCGSRAGPASLLNPSQLHHSRFLSIGIHFMTQCQSPDCLKTFVELQQHISVVFDIGSGTHQDFTLRSLFLHLIKPACPLASTSVIKFKVPSDASISPPIKKIEEFYLVQNLFELTSDTNYKVKLNKQHLETIHIPEGITSHCFPTGLGLEGGLRCSLVNNLPKNVTVVFFQVVPWFLYTQLHTLKLETESGHRIQPDIVNFAPAKIRESPHKLELVFMLLAQEVTVLNIQFTRGFQTWTEHPPDANHGYYISPACLTIPTVELGNLSRDHSSKVQRIFSEALLITIPVPDFSMPYNVICLVCTVIAVAFGSLHNLTTRRLQKVSPKHKSPLKKKIDWLLEKICKKALDQEKNPSDTR